MKEKKLIYDVRGNVLNTDKDIPNEEKKVRQAYFSEEQFKLNASIIRDTLSSSKSTSQAQNNLTQYKQSEVREIIKDYRKEVNQRKLVEISQSLYSTSAHYKRLINHFVGMPLYSVVINPTENIQTSTTMVSKVEKQYEEIGKLVKKMNLKHEFTKVYTTALIEDIFFGYVYDFNDSFYLRKFNSKICKITGVFDGVFCYAMDMDYFESNKDMLDIYPVEIQNVYGQWKIEKKTNNQISNWADIPPENTICIKISEEITETFPFFSGVFDSIYEIEGYKQLRKDGAEASNYMTLVQELPVRTESEVNNDFAIDPDAYDYFHRQLVDATPDNVGVAVSPMPVKVVKFDKTRAGDDNVGQATRDMWSSSGVSSLLFNSDGSTSQGLLNSIKVDEELVFKYLAQVERWLNRYLKIKFNKLMFNISVLPITTFNQKEKYDMYINAGQYGFPVKSEIGAVLGLSPVEVMSKAYLENDILKMHEQFIPLQSSHTQGSSEEVVEVDSNKEGRPEVDAKDASDETARAKDKAGKT